VNANAFHLLQLILVSFRCTPIWLDRNISAAAGSFYCADGAAACCFSLPCHSNI
jgi:hypothetical protein